MEEGERVIESEPVRTAAMEQAIAHVRATEPPHRAERWAELIHKLAHTPFAYVEGCERCDEWREECAAAGLPE